MAGLLAQVPTGTGSAGLAFACDFRRCGAGAVSG
jgi:hypothetical protein